MAENVQIHASADRSLAAAVYLMIVVGLISLASAAYTSAQAMGASAVVSLVIIALGVAVFAVQAFYIWKTTRDWEASTNAGRWRLTITGLVVPLLVFVLPIIAFALLTIFVIFAVISYLSGPANAFRAFGPTSSSPSGSSAFGSWWGGGRVLYGSDGRPTWIGDEQVESDSTGKPIWIGDREVRYDTDGRMSWVGDDRVIYGADGRPTWVGAPRYCHRDNDRVAARCGR
jgi:hypothetical protein